jgi:hypothetical protein
MRWPPSQSKSVAVQAFHTSFPTPRPLELALRRACLRIVQADHPVRRRLIARRAAQMSLKKIRSIAARDGTMAPAWIGSDC